MNDRSIEVWVEWIENWKTQNNFPFQPSTFPSMLNKGQCFIAWGAYNLTYELSSHKDIKYWQQVNVPMQISDWC